MALAAVGLGLTVLGIALTLWGMWRAKVFERQLPQIVAKAVATILRSTPPSGPADDRTEDLSSSPASTASRLALAGALVAIDHCDLDGDGREELLVQYPSGAHGTALKVFGWRNGEFVELVTTGVGTPVPFEFGDVDDDGHLEVIGTETDWAAGKPYVSAPRVRIVYRWQSGTLVEQDRHPTQGSVDGRRAIRAQTR